MSYRIGCDVGGTFTDLCLFDDETGAAVFVKTPTTTGHQADAVISATREALAEGGLSPANLKGFGHGTTVATNAIIERAGARTALLVTAGFRDLLAIGRQTRPHLYDQQARRPEPLVAEDLTFEVPERIGPDGAVREVLDEAAVREGVTRLLARGAETVAVVFLHSYANPVHERRVREILTEFAPGLRVSISSDILSEPGEFERASTTVMNAYLMPPLKSYLEQIAVTLADDGVIVEPGIMQSGGGLMSISTACGEKAVHTCLSGPAAGMIGARRFAEAAGYSDVVTIDMGGTSFDVGLIQDGEVLTRYDAAIEGFPLRVPMFDIITLGAGGGSIARVDGGGLLKVGPESAGAVPGPAVYGKGGTRPTVTDANVVLGRLRHGRKLGGGIVIDRQKAVDVVHKHIAKPLGLSVEAAAQGILDVVNAAMVRGMRSVTVERGLDPRAFAVMAFGGAGPLHAVDLCAELDVETVIIPPSPGILCGIGLLLAPWKTSETAMIGMLSADLSEGDLGREVADLFARQRAQAEKDGIDPDTVTSTLSLDLRYPGQGHPLSVAYDPDAGLAASVAAFHDLHRRNFGYARPEAVVDVSLLRLAGTAPVASDRLPKPAVISGEDPVVAHAPLWLKGKKLEVPVYDRARLEAGTKLSGPLIVEQQDTTLIVGDQNVTVDEVGSLIIRMNP